VIQRNIRGYLGRKRCRSLAAAVHAERMNRMVLYCTRTVSCGVMVSCCHAHGVILSWCHGVMVSWCHGVMVSWCHGVMVSWCHGVILSCCHGVMMSHPQYPLTPCTVFVQAKAAHLWLRRYNYHLTMGAARVIQRWWRIVFGPYLALKRWKRKKKAAALKLARWWRMIQMKCVTQLRACSCLCSPNTVSCVWFLSEA
jgi:hypothetical protein